MPLEIRSLLQNWFQPIVTISYSQGQPICHACPLWPLQLCQNFMKLPFPISFTKYCSIQYKFWKNILLNWRAMKIYVWLQKGFGPILAFNVIWSFWHEFTLPTLVGQKSIVKAVEIIFHKVLDSDLVWLISDVFFKEQIYFENATKFVKIWTL